jgi:glycosyltransferase involved in cell wall biosynthesis
MHRKTDRQPLISVIINCYNGEKYLREAIDSVYSQTNENWEIIFWDNASTDNSAKIAQSYDSKLKYFRSEKTIPLGAARNKAIEKCNGEYIAFLDCDDIWISNKLDKQIPLFNDQDVSLVYSDAIHFNKNGRTKTEFEQFKPIIGYVFPQIIKEYPIVLSSVIINRKGLTPLDEIFDTKLSMIEEFDLFTRMSMYSKFTYYPDILVKRRIHDKNWTFVQGYSDLPEELEHMKKKIDNISPGFQSMYPEEFCELCERIISWRAFNYWFAKNRSKALECLCQLKKKKRRKYLLTFFFILPFPLSRLIYAISNIILPRLK